MSLRPGGHRAPAHGKRRSFSTRRVLLIVAGVVVLVAVAGGAAYFVTNRHHTDPAAAQVPAKIVPLSVASTTPTSGATNVASDATLDVTFTTQLSADTPMPTLSPTVAGSWTVVSPTEVQFEATAPLVPNVQETLTIPGGSGGMVGANGQLLASTVTVPFTIAQAPELRLQELLAQLGYLPLTFSPTSPAAVPGNQLADSQPGSFAWRWSTEEGTLESLWTEGSSNVVTTGAVMDFEEQHNLETDGVAGPDTWTALLAAVEANQVNTQAYNNVVVSENDPETATVYSNGAAIYSTLVNTGVTGAATATGTYPVYLRYVTTTMSGTNVDGSSYVDPGIPWVSYFNGGDALHGYVRASYGFPQSNGCVEMPVANAATVYPLTPIGTLVTVDA